MDVTPKGRVYEVPDASKRLDDLEKIAKPTQYAKGRLSGLLLSLLSDRDRERAEALRAKWAKS